MGVESPSLYQITSITLSASIGGVTLQGNRPWVPWTASEMKSGTRRRRRKQVNDDGLFDTRVSSSRNPRDTTTFSTQVINKDIQHRHLDVFAQGWQDVALLRVLLLLLSTFPINSSYYVEVSSCVHICVD